MTSTQLAQRLARHLNVPDSANLSSGALLDVVNAINSGLHLFFTEAPSIYKRTTFSTVLKAPLSLSITFAAQYSNIVNGSPFDPTWYGCGIRATGMAVDNEISSISTVLDQWLSPTLTTQALVLFDAQIIPYTIERITSDVRAYNTDDVTCRILIRDDQGAMDRRRMWGYGNNSMNLITGNSWCQRYRIEPLGVIAGGTSQCLLRVHPYPSVDTIIRFEAEISAASLSVTDIINSSLLPIADAWVPLLTPLCEEALTYSPLWRDPKTKAEIRFNAANVIEKRIKKLANDFACPNNSVGTPYGF